MELMDWRLFMQVFFFMILMFIGAGSLIETYTKNKYGKKEEDK